MSLYNDVSKDNKNLTKDKYCGHSILLLESICEEETKYYPQAFLDKIFQIAY